MNEGASDEKYAALYAVEKLLIEKKDLVRKFERSRDDTSKVANGEIVLDLTGPDENAFALMGHANELCKTVGFDAEVD